MYNSNIDPVFNESIIWRYMDFWKFLSLLKEQALYFTRIDILKDRFEGRITPRDEKDIEDSMPTHTPQDRENVKDFYNSDRNNYYVNCWCMKDYESKLMWDAYTTNNTAVAIRSTDKMLKDSFNEKDEIQLAKVRYIERETTATLNNNAHSQITHKSKFYEDERELRAFTMKFVSVPKRKGFGYGGEAPPEKGLYVKVNLNMLIEEIVVKHTAPPKFEDLAIDVMKKYKLNKLIRRSDLAEQPNLKTSSF